MLLLKYFARLGVWCRPLSSHPRTLFCSRMTMDAPNLLKDELTGELVSKKYDNAH